MVLLVLKIEIKSKQEETGPTTWPLLRKDSDCDSDALVDLFGHWLKSSETDPLTVSL